MVLILQAKKANIPTLGPRFLVQFPRMGKALQVECSTYAPPPGLNIDRCIILAYARDFPKLSCFEELFVVSPGNEVVW